MAIIYDKNTGLKIGDPQDKPFRNVIPLKKEILKSFNKMILSASGWRKIFSANCDEESETEDISSADKLLSAAAAKVFISFLQNNVGKKNPVLAIAMDSRFTGPSIADVILRLCVSQNIEARYLFIAAAPEVMCWVNKTENIDGFIYISASHNPIGHNGFKFGFSNGGVLSGMEASALIHDYRKLLKSCNFQEFADLVNNADEKKLERIYRESHILKNDAIEKYLAFSLDILSGYDNKELQIKFINFLKEKAAQKRVGIITDQNGSARTLSIDRLYIENLNIKFKSVNSIPRQITHRIVPEGESLNLCCKELEKLHSFDPDFAFGYVPDNDGDRGNLVYMDGDNARIIEAQEVFALTVLSELAFLRWIGESRKTAVVINGPTSMRIERIADAFEVKTFRAEVGEANVINLAGTLRDQGFIVRILGEGTSGGNITYPAAVRDPINTIGSITKLLCLTSNDLKPGLFEIWCNVSNKRDYYREDYNLNDIIKTLPQFTTSSSYDENAIMKIQTKSHRVFKKSFEDLFPQEWNKHKLELHKLFGIESWIEINTEGIYSRIGTGSVCRSGNESGGLKILFRDQKDRDVAFIWMRGSGTEPVFRILADLEGNNKKGELLLLNWMRDLVNIADNKQ